jgi:flagellin
MRIQHNVAAMNSYRNFGINNSKMSKNLEKLSSGYAINRAGDDAAGLAVSEKMRAEISGLEAGLKNAKDAIGLIQTAEGALTEVHDMLNRMYYLSEQSANGTYASVDRNNLQEEFKALQDEIDRIGATADFNGTRLFTSASTALLKNKTVMVIGDLGYGGSKNQLKLSGFTLTQLKASKLGVGSAIKISTNTAATAANSAIKTAIDTVSKVRGKLGAYQNRIEHTINNLGVMKENITDAESRIRDTDVAEEMMKFTKNNIMNQASQAMLAQANQMPQGVLQLLQ